VFQFERRQLSHDASDYNDAPVPRRTNDCF